MKIVIVRYRNSGVIDTATLELSDPISTSNNFELLAEIRIPEKMDSSDLEGMIREAFSEGIRYGKKTKN